MHKTLHYRRLCADDIDPVVDLFGVAFQDDKYYARMFPDPSTRAAAMGVGFRGLLKWCLEQGEGEYCLGVFDDAELVAFALCFDYLGTKRGSPEVFHAIFSGDQDRSAPLPHEDKIHKPIEALARGKGAGGGIIFLLSVAVTPEWRNKGVAASVLDIQLGRFNKSHSLVADVSNGASLGMYRKRNFTVSAVDDDYWLVVHERGAPSHTASFGERIPVLVPETASFSTRWPYRADNVKVRYLPDMSREGRDVCDSFCSLATFGGRDSHGGMLFPSLAVDLDREEFLQFQRHLNLAVCDERFYGDAVYYESNREVREVQLHNDVLDEMLPSHAKEWSVIPDTFISCPMKYDSITTIEDWAATAGEDEKSRTLLNYLDFRTKFEAGIPIDRQEVDSLASFKGRIKRYYLGKILVSIVAELDSDKACDAGYDQDNDQATIGAPAFVDMVVTLDAKSNCAVLTWFSLSTPFLISHLLDNVMRNELYILDNSRRRNLYAYLGERLGLVKRGTPKAYLVIPHERTCLDPSQTASLLAAETIYPDGEVFGRIIDGEIIDIVKSETGMGQYDRATVLAHTNVVLQFGGDHCLPVAKRLEEGSIALFFIELILLEEAAIHIADCEIESLFTSPAINTPSRFLKSVDKINDDYYRTMEFWDIQLNFPTSCKSLKMLRDAFKMKEQLEYMQRNQAELKNAFETKSDLIDRMESRRMNVALAALSVLTVFSALIDCHQYVETFGGASPHPAIHVVQRMLSVAIILVVAFVVRRLFGRKTR